MDQNEFVYNINHLCFEDIKPVKRNFKMKKRAYTDKKYPSHLHYIDSPLGHISGNSVVADLARVTEYLKRMKIPCQI